MIRRLPPSPLLSAKSSCGCMATTDEQQGHNEKAASSFHYSIVMDFLQEMGALPYESRVYYDSR
jgi:hypothetical protein